jgi:O-antigen ligase
MPITFSRLKTDAVIALFAGSLILNYGFFALRIPPSEGGVPLGEALAAVYLATLNWPRVLANIAAAGPIVPILGWWIFGFTRLLFDASANGLWAFRDATQVIDSLYIAVGFVIAAQPDNIARFFRTLPWILGGVGIYALTIIFPGADRLGDVSPKLPGGSGQEIPIFGNYGNTAAMLLWLAAYLLLVRGRNRRMDGVRVAVAASAIVMTIVVLQERTTYIQLVLLIALLFVFRRGTLLRMGVVIPVFVLAVGIIELTHIQLPGRLTSKISFSFFLDHIKAMVGASQSQELAGAAEGVAQRMVWWTSIYQRLMADPITTATGLGYGIPLIDFAGPGGIVIREPHNSIISVSARLGVIGLFLWTWMQIGLFRVWLVTLRAARRLNRPEIVERLCFLVSYFVLVLGQAYGEDAFEKPYFAIPYYFFWGVILRMHLDFARGDLARAPQQFANPLSPMRPAIR